MRLEAITILCTVDSSGKGFYDYFYYLVSGSQKLVRRPLMVRQNSEFGPRDIFLEPTYV
jgi:hypothetical protein